MAKFSPLHSDSVFIASQLREPDHFEINTVHNPLTQQEIKTIKLMLFVDTGLFPTEKPTRTLGVMEQERWINLPIELVQQSSDGQITAIQNIITNHYSNHPRGLPLWGDIQRYCFYKFLANGDVYKIWFDIHGILLDI